MNKILDTILPYEARAEFCKIHILFVFKAMHFQNKKIWDLLTFSKCISSVESLQCGYNALVHGLNDWSSVGGKKNNFHIGINVIQIGMSYCLQSGQF